VDFQPMSPDELSRAVQFLLTQQAASEARFDARMEQLTQKTDRVADGLIGLTAIVGRVVDTVSSLADAQKHTDEQLRLSESHLNVLIEMFERHLREDHGHEPS